MHSTFSASPNKTRNLPILDFHHDLIAVYTINPDSIEAIALAEPSEDSDYLDTSNYIIEAEVNTADQHAPMSDSEEATPLQTKNGPSQKRGVSERIQTPGPSSRVSDSAEATTTSEDSDSSHSEPPMQTSTPKQSSSHTVKNRGILKPSGVGKKQLSFAIGPPIISRKAGLPDPRNYWCNTERPKKKGILKPRKKSLSFSEELEQSCPPQTKPVNSVKTPSKQLSSKGKQACKKLATLKPTKKKNEGALIELKKIFSLPCTSNYQQNTTHFSSSESEDSEVESSDYETDKQQQTDTVKSDLPPKRKCKRKHFSRPESDDSEKESSDVEPVKCSKKFQEKMEIKRLKRKRKPNPKYFSSQYNTKFAWSSGDETDCNTKHSKNEKGQAKKPKVPPKHNTKHVPPSENDSETESSDHETDKPRSKPGKRNVKYQESVKSKVPRKRNTKHVPPSEIDSETKSSDHETDRNSTMNETGQEKTKLVKRTWKPNLKYFGPEYDSEFVFSDAETNEKRNVKLKLPAKKKRKRNLPKYFSQSENDSEIEPSDVEPVKYNKNEKSQMKVKTKFLKRKPNPKQNFSSEYDSEFASSGDETDCSTKHSEKGRVNVKSKLPTKPKLKPKSVPLTDDSEMESSDVEPVKRNKKSQGKVQPGLPKREPKPNSKYFGPQSPYFIKAKKPQGRYVLDIKTKVAIMRDVMEGALTKKEIATKFSIPLSTLAYTVKNCQAMLNNFLE